MFETQLCIETVAVKKFEDKRVYFYPFIIGTPNKIPNPPPIPELPSHKLVSIKKAPRKNLMKYSAYFSFIETSVTTKV